MTATRKWERRVGMSVRIGDDRNRLIRLTNDDRNCMIILDIEVGFWSTRSCWTITLEATHGRLFRWFVALRLLGSCI